MRAWIPRTYMSSQVWWCMHLEPPRVAEAAVGRILGPDGQPDNLVREVNNP